MELAGDEAAIVVTGSLFVAAAVRETWFDHKAGQASAQGEMVKRQQGAKKNEK